MSNGHEISRTGETSITPITDAALALYVEKPATGELRLTLLHECKLDVC